MFEGFARMFLSSPILVFGTIVNLWDVVVGELGEDAGGSEPPTPSPQAERRLSSSEPEKLRRHSTEISRRPSRNRKSPLHHFGDGTSDRIRSPSIRRRFDEAMASPKIGSRTTHVPRRNKDADDKRAADPLHSLLRQNELTRFGYVREQSSLSGFAGASPVPVRKDGSDDAGDGGGGGGGVPPPHPGEATHPDGLRNHRAKSMPIRRMHTDQATQRQNPIGEEDDEEHDPSHQLKQQQSNPAPVVEESGSNGGAEFLVPPSREDEVGSGNSSVASTDETDEEKGGGETSRSRKNFGSGMKALANKLARGGSSQDNTGKTNRRFSVKSPRVPTSSKRQQSTEVPSTPDKEKVSLVRRLSSMKSPSHSARKQQSKEDTAV